MRGQNHNHRDSVIIFLNPGAGTGIPEEFEKMINDHFSGMDCTYRIIKLGGEDEGKKVEKELDDFDPSVAVAAGGDGTVNLVAARIMGRGIKLGILPLGSSNALAYQFQIPDDIPEALDIITGGSTRSIDLLRINREHICLHMCDLGMNARVVKRYQRENIRGLYGYARQYLREVGNRHRFKVSLNTGERSSSLKVVMLILANGSHYGTGARVAPEGSPDDGWFEVVAIQSYPFWFLLYMFVSLVTGRVNEDRFSKIVRCRSVRISVSPPQEMQVDGEPLGTHSGVEAEILPGGLEIITS